MMRRCIEVPKSQPMAQAPLSLLFSHPRYVVVAKPSGVAVHRTRGSHGTPLLQRLRDEAHRFALTFHRKIRDKRMTGSALEEVPGVGPRRKRLLLRTFGSVEGIRRSSVDELAAVPTMTKRLAEQIREYLNDV